MLLSCRELSSSTSVIGKKIRLWKYDLCCLVFMFCQVTFRVVSMECWAVSTRMPLREWPTLGSINSSLVLSTATYCLSSLLLCIRGGLLIFQTGIVRPRPAGVRGPKSSGDGLRKVSAEPPGLRAQPKSERVHHRPVFNGRQAPGEKSMYCSSDDAVYTAKQSFIFFACICTPVITYQRTMHSGD